MKHLPITLVLFFILSSTALTPAYAQTPVSSRMEARKEARLDATSERLKTRAEAEIKRRITALNEVKTKVNSLKRLSDEQKAMLSKGIEGEIANLNTLNTKIAGDTDITMLRTDVKAIVDDYRVFLFYIPQVRIMATADALLTSESQLENLHNKLLTRVTEAKDQGKDLSGLEATLNDMQTKLDNAQLFAKTAITQVESLSPEGYPGNKTELETARVSLQTARTDLKVALNDAQVIMRSLKYLPPALPTATQ